MRPGIGREKNLKKKLALVVAAALSLALMAVAFHSRAGFAGQAPQLSINLGRPDVLIRSGQLSAVPRDLVALPGLRDVLTQEFVNYYEEHPDRLTLDGTLRRLAFEHDLTWQDHLVAAVLDAPGELALWSDGKGRLAYAALLLEKNAAAQTLEQLAKVGLPDSQLSHAGTLRVNDADATVYALQLNARSTLLMVSSGKRLLVLTQPGMLLDSELKLSEPSVAAARALLDRSTPSPWREDFQLAAPATGASGHTLVAKAAWLSFGYQPFFPHVHAVKLDVAGQNWSLGVAGDPSAWQGWPRSAGAAWATMPRGAAFCAALPVSWERAGPPISAMLGADASGLLADLEPGAGLCWYPANGLYAPVVSLQLKAGTGARHDASLKTLLEKSAKSAKDKPQVATQRPAGANGRLWTTQVNSPLGYLGSGADRAHRLALLRHGDALVASVDHRAIDQALAVSGKTFPALADEFPGAPLMLSGTPELSRLLLGESQRLTRNTPGFQEQVRSQLKPRLEALGASGRVAFVAPRQPASAEAGQPWVWNTLDFMQLASGTK